MTDMNANAVDASKQGRRLVWLDLVRIYCALLIVGVHWLRACYRNGLLGPQDRVNLVGDYQAHRGVVVMLHHLLVAGTSARLSTWLTNIVGLLAGFGWEAVSALILVSGFSLSVFANLDTVRGSSLLSWYEKRAKRILVPFYLVAIPFLALYLLLLEASAHVHGKFAGAIHEKLVDLFHTPVLGVVLSHSVLFDPFQREGLASFFAPAWWFVPAILLAYLLYPLLNMLTARVGSIPTLLIALSVTLCSYEFGRGILIDECWYFIVVQECFNFTLGVVAGNLWRSGRNAEISKVLFSSWSLPLGFAMFVAGSVANWSGIFHPIASALFGPGLVIGFAYVAKRFEERRAMRAVLRVDAYDVYLVHQPFAFPIALAGKFLLHGFTVFVGGIVYVGVVIVASLGFAAAQRAVNPVLFRAPRAKLRREDATSTTISG